MMVLWLPVTLLWDGICVRTLVTFTKLLYKQFPPVSKLSGELSSEKCLLKLSVFSVFCRTPYLFLSPALGSVRYLKSVLINLLPRMEMSRVESVTSAKTSTRRTV